MKKNILLILTTFIITVLAVGIGSLSFIRSQEKDYKYRQLQSELMFQEEPTIEKKYQSERSFGSDYLDAYAVQISENDSFIDGEPLNEEYYSIIDDYKEMINTDSDNNQWLEDLQNLENQDNTYFIYKQDRNRGYQVLYIFNDQQKTAYQIELKI